MTLAQRHFCKECNRFIPTGVCTVHGPSIATPADSRSINEPFPISADMQKGPLKARSNPALIHNEKRDGQYSHVYQPGRTVPRRPGRPAPVNLIRLENSPAGGNQILRFIRSERLLHWAIALPFMLCWITAFILFVFYNPHPMYPLRDVFSAIHRISAICMTILPVIVIVTNRNDYFIHVHNVKSAWLWTWNDIKWLVLIGPAAINKRIKLPEQGKFNAAEKVNFILVMVSWPILIASGIMVWLPSLAWIAWLVHISAALLVTPTMLGHIYMATINAETRKGLRGMISGSVDKNWAKHHYAIWYRENFEKDILSSKVAAKPAFPADQVSPANPTNLPCRSAAARI